MDKDGKIVKELPYDHISKENFFNSLEKFKGKIEQTPPMYSFLTIIFIYFFLKIVGFLH